ncbi:toll-like receptor Tollo [Teleopsis dalmanni]|uniref:toll-like receptor Tollo n=1 Tax=Teleopsis dalmanni TaxID=139649 RepID=UPI0018CF9342|nr:toll-like receptor Tollo [Teleopsis dalmanni]
MFTIMLKILLHGFTVFLCSLYGATLNSTVLYQAPDECSWIGSDNSDITLICHLRTINSELENTNFSVIQSQNTRRLRLMCNDDLFLQSSLNTDSFHSLVDLRDLTIEYCKFGQLTQASFRGLYNLRNLTIRTHNVDWSTMSLNISSNSFNEFRQLDHLDLSFNNIRFIPDGMVCPLKVLKYLNMSFNEIKDLSSFRFSASITSRKFHICGSSLISLDVSSNKISIFPSAILSGLSFLKYLNLSRNNINFVADRAFEALFSLSVLDLSDNHLTSLPPELFAETKLMKELYVKNNSINILAPGLFNHLHELRLLDLSMNSLNSQWVNPETFIGLRQLILLDLSYNRINKLESNIFQSLLSLETLKLQNNYISNIDRKSFLNLKNLRTLILSNNRISLIEDFTFHGLFGLLVLSLDYNLISEIDLQSFKNCSAIQDLHLNSNKLSSIPDALHSVQQLRTLDLGENFITNIENTSISTMKNLFGLRLTENSINYVRCGAFRHMTSLQILNLSGNKITDIETCALQHNKELQAVRLDSNYLRHATEVFVDLPNLVWLNMSDNLLENFDYSLISKGLQWLDVRANRINHLGNYLQIETEFGLSTFHGGYNMLTEINASSIPLNIEILYLNDNLISTIQPYTFFRKQNLMRVYLIRNKLTTLDPNTFRLSPVSIEKEMPQFYVSGNPINCNCDLDWIQKINKDSRTQPDLVDLDNIYCKLKYAGGITVPLTEVQTTQLLCKYESHCFALCHCCDYRACDCKMECPNRCSCFHDTSWILNMVDCSQSRYDHDLPPLIPMDTTQLYLDGNDFKVLSSHAFIGRKRLRVLYLNRSCIETIHNRTFNGLLNLEVLQLSHNDLKHLNGDEFQGLNNLQELYLEYNAIVSIDIRTFTRLYNLKILRLDHNFIAEFAIWNFLPPYIIDIWISENRWTCKCDFITKLRDFIERKPIVKDKYLLYCSSYPDNTTNNFSQSHPEKFKIYYDSESQHDRKINYVICNGSNSDEMFTNVFYNKQFIGNVIFSDDTNATRMILSQSSLQYFVPTLVTLLTLCILITIIILFVFIFRQEIRVWFHSRFGVRLFNKLKDTDKNEREKLFDAFVSYSFKDETFIRDVFAPMLEQGDAGYKLCLHHRDFPIGTYTTNTIVQTINTSRRTIMILSENYIKSEWCNFEFKSAHQSVFRDRRRRLIVVLLGNVVQRDLDPDLCLYLKTNIFLKWGDKLFWEKLRFALPDVPKNQRRTCNQNSQCTNVGMHIPIMENHSYLQNYQMNHLRSDVQFPQHDFHHGKPL